MRIVRNNIFETNSSSTHTLTICTKAEYEKWQAGELLLDTHANKMVGIPQYDERYLRSKFLRLRAKQIVNGYVYEDKYYATVDDMVDDKDIVIAQEDLDSLKHDYSLRSFSEYMNYVSDGLEFSEVEYVSPSGDEIVGFGYGGYDG